MKFLNILLVIFFVKQRDEGKTEESALNRSRSEIALLLSLYILIISMLFKYSIGLEYLLLKNGNIFIAILIYFPVLYGVYSYCWNLEQINHYLSDANNDTFIYRHAGWSIFSYVITIVIFLFFLNI